MDREGRPVTDLTKADFRLSLNGQPWPIDWVEPPPTEASPAALPARGPEPTRTADAASEGAATPRKHSTVYFVDNSHLDFGSRRQGLLALKRHLRSLPPDEEVAVYSFDFGLKTLQRFTRDRAAVEAALGRLGRTLPSSIYTEEQTQEWVSRSRQVLLSFSHLFRSLASRPELKTVVILGGYLPQTGIVQRENLASVARLDLGAARARPSWAKPGPGGTGSPHTDVYTFYTERDDAVGLALLANATIIGLDPSGLIVPEPGDPSVDGVKVTSATTASSLQNANAPSFALAFRFDTLAEMAAATGGARLGGSNRPDQLLVAQSALLGRRFRIGFTPPDQGSIRREIRVEVARPGFSVCTAAGQRTLTTEEKARGRFAALLLAEGGEAPDFAIQLEALDKASTKRRGKVLRYDVVVPLSEIYLHRGPKGVTADMEVLVAAIDGEGRTSQLQFQPVSLEIPDSQAAAASRSIYRYSGRFTFNHFGKGRLWVGIRDRATNRLGYAAVDFRN